MRHASRPREGGADADRAAGHKPERDCELAEVACQQARSHRARGAGRARRDGRWDSRDGEGNVLVSARPAIPPQIDLTLQNVARDAAPGGERAATGEGGVAAQECGSRLGLREEYGLISFRTHLEEKGVAVRGGGSA